jgi:hypothetical protein
VEEPEPVPDLPADVEVSGGRGLRPTGPQAEVR